MGIRLVALDLDGTVLDAHGQLGTGVCEAVARVRDRGIDVVLCTGRRFRTARPIAEALELTGAIVVNNGALVKDIESGHSLERNFLSPDVYDEAIGLMREHGPPLVYVDAYHEQLDFLTERVDEAHPFQREYVDDYTEVCRIVPDLAASRPDGVIMISTMADGGALAALRARAEAALGERVRTHALINKNYRGHILEFLSPDSGKWAALRQLAEKRGVEIAEVAAIGDDTNDVEMIAGAGLGIAMGNATPAAREAACITVRSNAEGGVIEGLERVLLEAP
jgi:Cof subfamily protein (haloacid dehalogenase superfamily)